MGKVKKSENYKLEQIKDAEQILDIYMKLSEDKRTILTAMLNAFISGMETQERLSSSS